MKTFSKKQVTCEDVQGNKHQVAVDKLSFRPTVRAVIQKGEKVLLIKQWGNYDFPGGGVELGETLEQALAREVLEETGYQVKVERIIHAEISFFKLPFKDDFVQSIHLFYQCKLLDNEPETQVLSEQEKQYVGKLKWVEIGNLQKIKILVLKNTDVLIDSLSY